MNKKWDITCKISNIVLSVIYAVSFLFPFGLGLTLLSLGFAEKTYIAVCSLISSLLLLLTPVFCVLAIVFSIVFRKKQNYVASLLIQFLPFGTIGVAVIAFFLSVVQI